MPFCPDCGARLEAGSKYCTDCGARVPVDLDSGPVFDAAIESTGAETVVAIIPNLMRVRGLGILLKGPVWQHLVLTSQRIIVVQRSRKGLDRLKQDIGNIAPDYEFIFLKTMKPERILDENHDSKVIPLIELVALEVLIFSSYSTEDGIEPYWQVQITTKKGILKLRTDYHDDPGEYFQNPALKRLFGERLVLQEM